MRESALAALVALLDLLPPDVRRAQALPALRTHMQPLELELALQRCVAGVMGPLVSAVSMQFFVQGWISGTGEGMVPV